MSFSLHPTLEKDLTEIKHLGLSTLYLLPDPENPWLVLVPKVMKEDGTFIKEIFELTEEDQITLTSEISELSKLLSNAFSADKINIGALGNMVPQLHIHIIARFHGDRAWPGAIWGTSGTESESNKEKAEAIKEKITSLL